MAHSQLPASTSEYTSNLYAVDPWLRYLTRFVENLVGTLLQLYIGLFYLFGTGILLFFAVTSVVIALGDLFHCAQHWPQNTIAILFGTIVITSFRVRAFVWVFLGCSFIWILALTIPMLAILGENCRFTAPVAQIVLCTIYLVPPFVVTFMVDRTRKWFK